MTKRPPPLLAGHDTLLEAQAHEMAALRAARSDRHATEGERRPKRYRLGPENPDGSVPIDVADRDTHNWRERETCPNVEVAEQRVQQLTADDTQFFRAVSIGPPDRAAPRMMEPGDESPARPRALEHVTARAMVALRQE